MTPLSRRDLLRRGGLAAAALAGGSMLAGCADADTPDRATAPAAGGERGSDFDGQTLRLVVYSGLTENLYRDHFVAAFERQTGATVELEAAWTEAAAKLASARGSNPPYDVIQSDPTQGRPLIDQGLIETLDPSLVPNSANFAPRLLDTSLWSDGFGLPFHSSAMTLSWNTELVPDGLTQWQQLLSTGGDRGVMIYKLAYMSLFTYAAMKAEADGAPGQAREMFETDLDGVFAYAAANTANVQYFWPATTDGVNALVRGEVAAGNMHGNGLLAPLRAGQPVQGVVPDQSIGYAQLMFSLCKGSPVPELGHAALNFIASEDFQRALAASGEYAAAIPAVAQEQAASDEVWAAAFPHTDEDFDTLQYYPYDAYYENQAKIEDTWSREILRGA